MGMEKKTRNIPRLLLKSAIKPLLTRDLSLNSPKMTSPHFTIRVTEFNQNMSKNTIQLDRNTMSKNILRSIEKIVPRASSPSVSADNEFVPARKKIKMSEEIPSKRVILVLPNESSSISQRNNSDEKDVTTTHNYHESIIENTFTEAELNQSMTDSSDKSSVYDRLSQKSEFASMNSITEINTDEGFHETSVSGETLINNNIDEKVMGIDILTPLSNKLANSFMNINHNTPGQNSLTTSTPKLHRNLPPRCQYMRIKKLPKSQFYESRNIPFNGLMRSAIESSKTQQQSVKTREKIPVLNNDPVIPIPSLSSDKVKTIIKRNSASGNSSFRQIKINGLILKAIDPTILNDKRFKERIKVLNLSHLNGITSKTAKSLQAGRISESVVTTTTAELPQKITKQNLDCEECEQLRSKVDKQWQTILNLKHDLMESIALTSEKTLSNFQSDNEELKSKILKQMNGLNKKLSEDLRRERICNIKLRTEIESRDKHIEELECELAHVSKLFGEMKTKSVSLKKLIYNDSQLVADDEFSSDFVSVNYSDIESSQQN